MTPEQKNINFSSGGTPFYREWVEKRDACPAETAAFLKTAKADAFVRSFLNRLNGASPYLIRLILTEPDFIAQIVEKGWDAVFSGLLKTTFTRLYAVETDSDVLSRELRILKRRAALVIALADIAGDWNLTRVTHALSVLADACTRIATAAVLSRAHKKGDLILPDPARPEKDCGYFLIAMGKLGALELNYSSDIDLIVLYDGDKVPYAGKRDAGSFFVRMTREIIALLDDKTAFGYVFRVDLRLRPDPGSTPVALGTQAAACYYESFAQNWERAAFIKARIVAGDKAAGAAFLKEIKPFIWRRTTDFYALRQIGDIKRMLGARSTDTPDKAGFNIKLGQGGIREIEFYTQLQQLLWGGRDPALRAKGTLVALNALVGAGWVDSRDRDDLAAAYDFLRRLEHRLQMVDDQQTQTLPETAAGLDALARFCGFESRESFLRVLSDHCARVRRIYDSLFGGAEHDPETPELSFGGAELPPETAARLIAAGFKDTVLIGETVRGWLSGRYRALRSERARALMEHLLTPVFGALAKSENPDAAFLAFDEFLRGLPAGVQLFALFQSRPALLDLLTELICAAPSLSRELIRHNDLFDAVLNPSFFSPFPSRDELTAEAQSLTELADDDEQALDAMRRFAREQKFRCAVLFLRGLMNRDEPGRRLADLARAVLTAIRPVVMKPFEERYGRFDGAAFSFILLGKAGSAEMSFSSDLDILFVYDVPDASAVSAGGVSGLSAGVYYARLAQRFVGALTANTRDGVLWPVDMRLRPSGNAGPAAVSLDAFVRYYEQSAWTWEMMALTKADVVWGEREALGGEIEKCLRRSRDPETLAADVAGMRLKIKNQTRVRCARDLIKYGDGGMIDIEFSVQYLQLKFAGRYPELLQKAVVPVLETAAETGLIEKQRAQNLIGAYRLWTLLSAVFSLCGDDVEKEWDDISAPTVRLLCRMSGVADKASLLEKIKKTAQTAASDRLF